MNDDTPLLPPLALSAAWLAAFVAGNVWLGSLYWGVGAAAVIVLAVYGRGALAAEPRAGWPLSVLVGVVSGALGVALAHVGLFVVGRLVPALIADVAAVYAAGVPGWVDLVLITPVVVVAEEVLWRHALLDALGRRLAPVPAAAIAVGVYGVAQGGAGSPAVVVAALALGAGMVLLKKLRGGLCAPLAAHMVFTLGVLAVFPLS